MKFRRSPLWLLLLTFDNAHSQQPPSYAKGGTVSNFQRYAAEDQALPTVHPTAAQATPPLSSAIPPTPVLPSQPVKISSVAATTFVPIVTQSIPPVSNPTNPQSRAVPSTPPVAAPPLQAVPPTPVAAPPLQTAPRVNPTAVPPHSIAASAPTLRPAPVVPSVRQPPPPIPNVAPTIAPQANAAAPQKPVYVPPVAAVPVPPQADQSRRLAELEINLRAREQALSGRVQALDARDQALSARDQALSAREKSVAERATSLSSEVERAKSLQELYEMKNRSLEEEKVHLEELKSTMNLKTQNSIPVDLAERDLEATKLEILEALRMLKFRKLYEMAVKIPNLGLHRALARNIYELKREFIESFNLDENPPWETIFGAVYRSKFGNSRLGMLKFFGFCSPILACIIFLRQLSLLKQDQKALADRQEILLSQFSIVTDLVKRSCSTTNRYCENAINDLILAQEQKDRAFQEGSTGGYNVDSKVELDRKKDEKLEQRPGARLPEETLRRAEYREMYTENNAELTHRIFQLLLTLTRSSISSSGQNRLGEENSTQLNSHLLYLEWLTTAHHKDLIGKLEKLEDKLDLVNLQVAAATECIYNDCVAQIRDSTKWLPFLELIEAYIARDIEGTFRDLVKQFAANPKDDYVIQQLMSELHKLGGIFDCRAQKILNGVDDGSLREKYRLALAKAHEKFLELCPPTDVLKPPERFERLVGTVELFRKVVFGVLNQLPISSVDVSNYVAQVYGGGSGIENPPLPQTMTARDSVDDQQTSENFSYSPIMRQNTGEENVPLFVLPDPLTANERLRALARPPANYTEYVEWFRAQMLNAPKPPPPYESTIPSLPTFQPGQNNQHNERMDAQFTLA